MEYKGNRRRSLNWPATRGDDLHMRFRVKNKITKAGIDVSAWTFTGVIVKTDKPGATVITTITLDKSEGSGWVTARVPAATTLAALTAGDYYYEIRATRPVAGGGTATRTFFGGKMTVTARLGASE